MLDTKGRDENSFKVAESLNQDGQKIWACRLKMKILAKTQQWAVVL